MNPILPCEHFIPDAEAHVADDGRLYLYGSSDMNGRNDYCSDRYFVFSSDDLIHWTAHGESFHLERAHSREARQLYAPDCFYKNGKAYLLYCGNDGSEGMAESESPTGPFGPGRSVQGADGDGIDPTALVDDDGSVYYFWGQFHLRGAKLKADLSGIDESTYVPSLLDEATHGFHEGASIRKRNGIYYMVYADTHRGKASCLSYATSAHPLGPYEKRGVIIDNDGCDPGNWNNHGSIEVFNDQWYVFYHRASQGTRYNRRVCIEPITFNADGTIDEVEMTTQGISPPRSSTVTMQAWRACRLHGGLRTASVQMVDGRCEEHLTNVQSGDAAEYRYLQFSGEEHQLHLTVGNVQNQGEVGLRLDGIDGPLIAECTIPKTCEGHAWQELSCPLQDKVTGTHAVVLCFIGDGEALFDLKDFRFEPK